MAALPLVLAVLVAMVVAIRANLYFMRPTAALLHQFDEAYATALARRMLLGGFLPYVDGVSHRGPLFYVSIALAIKIFGNGTWMPVRALSLVAILATTLFGFVAAWRARRRIAGSVMALLYVGVPGMRAWVHVGRPGCPGRPVAP